MKVRIYILCYNDKSEASARHNYGDKPWATVVRFCTTTVYFENTMYSNWLMDHYDEWKDADYVGTLSWRASQKINVPDMDVLQRQLETFWPDVVAFYGKHYHLVDQANYFHPKFKQIWIPWLKALGYDEYITCNLAIKAFYCNYWMAKPAWMLRYIDFFRRAKAVLETLPAIQEDLWSDSHYKDGNLLPFQCQELFGRPYYPYHPFLCERLPSFFFWNANAKVWFA